ncbi:MAG: aminotransferase class I/II-fold pyridoxal phosphate-dependent enzyme [Bacteroidota bacterium]
MKVIPSVKERKGLRNFMLAKNKLSLAKRTEQFHLFLDQLKANEHYSYQRVCLTPMDREVVIHDPFTQQPKKMLMFASNNYLGLGNHPHLRKKVQDVVNDYGIGFGGPPLLNGYSRVMQALEEKIAAFKGTESAIIFPAGFMANLGAISALAQKNDLVIHDQLSHASLHTALNLSTASDLRFRHNNVEQLETLLIENKDKYATVFAAMEGVYSMDGDCAPLDEMIPVCKKHDAFVVLDDAHGIGVLGAHGRGAAEAFDVEAGIDLHVGTFSKVFAVSGGYLAGSKDVLEYLRYFARPYVFSAALPPMTLAAVSAGIDVIIEEPERRSRLQDTVKYAAHKLKDYGLVHQPAGAILALQVPRNMNIRAANRELHELGIFINAIEYPAVSINKQRFRASICANHTRADIDQLADAFDKIWNDSSFYA